MPFGVYESLIGKVFIPYFQKKGEEAIPFLVNGEISSDAFLAVYKTLEPIESLPQDRKEKMWKYVNETFPEKSPEEKLKACKIVYCLGTVEEFLQG